MSTATSLRPLNGALAAAPGAKLLGEILSWSCAGLTVKHSDLVAALRDSSLDETVARELLPRHAFARACRKLAKQRIIKPVTEDANRILFQFTQESKAGDRYEYTLETLLTLEKTTGKVSCDLAGLATLAQELLDHHIEVRSGADLTRVIQRLFERKADLFPVRPQGGCYFVPHEHAGFVDKIDTLVGKVHGRLWRFPVPAGTAHGDRSVKEAVASGLATLIQEHRQAVAEFDTDTRESTLERAAERIRLTRFKVQTYAAYLAEERDHLEKDLANAAAVLRQKVEDLAATHAPPAAQPNS
jgi:hypothetical protein